MTIKDKFNLILNKISSKKYLRILSIFSIVFLFGFVFVNNANAGWSLGNIFLGLISSLFEAVAFIFFQISRVFIVIFNSIIQSTGAFVSGTVVDIVWTFIRDLVNMTFIIAMLITAVYKMIGKEDNLRQGSFKKQIVYILIGAFIINFSKVLFGAIVDITNLISMIFVNSYKDSINNVFSNLFQFKLATDGYRSLLESILLLIFGLGLFAYCATLLFYSVVRMVVLAISTMFSPLVVFLFFFPIKSKNKNFMENLDKLQIREKFFSFAIGGIIVTFFLWISLMILSAGGTGTLDNTIFGTPEAQVMEAVGTGKEASEGSVNTPEGSDFWNSILLKIVAVAVLLYSQKLAMSMAKDVGENFNKFVSGAADKVNKVGMAPLDSLKSFGMGAVNSAKSVGSWSKMVGSKALDSTTGGASRWIDRGENFLSKGTKDIMSVANNLRLGGENTNKYLTDRKELLKNRGTIAGDKAWNDYVKKQSLSTEESARRVKASMATGAGSLMDNASQAKNNVQNLLNFKGNRDGFITEKVVEQLSQDVDRSEFSVDNKNENFVNALLSSEGLLTGKQKTDIDNEKDPQKRIKMAEKFYNNSSLDANKKKEIVSAQLNKKYNTENSDRREKAQQIRGAVDSGNLGLASKLAADVYDNKTFGIDKNKIDTSYNTELDRLTNAALGKDNKKLSKEGRKIKSLEEKKNLIKSYIESGVGTYTDKDVDAVDEEIKLQVKKRQEKKARAELFSKKKIFEEKKQLSTAEINELKSRQDRFNEMGGDNTISELSSQLKYEKSDVNYLDEKGGYINKFLSETKNESKESFNARLQDMVKNGGMTSSMASFISSERSKNTNLSLDDLKKSKNTKASDIQEKISTMEANRLSDTEKEKLNINYEAIQKARKEYADSSKDIEKQEEDIEKSRQKSAGVYESKDSDKLKAFKDLQSDIKQKYTDLKTGEVNVDNIDLVEFLDKEKLSKGKYVLRSGTTENFAASLALKLSKNGQLTPVEQRMLEDDGFRDVVMGYVTNSGDNTLREEWNKQTSKTDKYKGLIPEYRANIIEKKPKLEYGSFEERAIAQNSAYSFNTRNNKAIEYIASNRDFVTDRNGKIDTNAVYKALKSNGYGGLSKKDVREIIQRADDLSFDVDMIEKYNENSNTENITTSAERIKNMYQNSRRSEYESRARSSGIKDKEQIEKYIENAAYEDVMKLFPTTIFDQDGEKSGVGSLIKQDLSLRGYTRNNSQEYKNAQKASFINILKNQSTIGDSYNSTLITRAAEISDPKERARFSGVLNEEFKKELSNNGLQAGKNMDPKELARALSKAEMLNSFYKANDNKSIDKGNIRQVFNDLISNFDPTLLSDSKKLKEFTEQLVQEETISQGNDKRRISALIQNLTGVEADGGSYSSTLIKRAAETTDPAEIKRIMDTEAAYLRSGNLEFGPIQEQETPTRFAKIVVGSEMFDELSKVFEASEDGGDKVNKLLENLATSFNLNLKDQKQKEEILRQLVAEMRDTSGKDKENIADLVSSISGIKLTTDMKDILSSVDNNNVGKVLENIKKIDEINKELEKIKSGGVSNFENITKTINSAKETIQSLNSILGNTPSSLKMTEPLENKISDVNFVMNLANGAYKKDDSKEAEKEAMDLSRRTMAHIERLLRSALKNTTDNDSIEKKINAFIQGVVNGDQDFIKILNDIAQNNDLSDKDSVENFAAWEVVINAISNMTDKKALIELKENISKNNKQNQQEILKRIDKRIDDFKGPDDI